MFTFPLLFLFVSRTGFPHVVAGYRNSVFAGVAGEPAPAAAQEPTPAKQLPDFQFTTLNGREFTRASLHPDRLSFFLFFDSDCEHCQRAADHLRDQLNGFTGVSIYLVSLDPPEKISAFLNAHLPGVTKNPDAIVLRDIHDQFRWRFHPYHYPGMFLYSPKGQLLDYEDNDESVFRITGSIRRWKNSRPT